MKKSTLPDNITIDLSKLAPEDRQIVYAQLLRAQKFATDIPSIRKVKPDVADKLITSFNSKQSSVFAESEIIADKVNKGNVTLITVSPHSTDAFYIQDKIGGIYSRLEIKSIIQDDASAVDREINNAEVQHRDRLNDEEDKPTWHKTTIVVGSPDNPWPFSHMAALKSALNDRILLLSTAETRIDKLLLGSLQPSKVIMRAATSSVQEMLKEAEKRSAKIESNPLTPIKRDVAPSAAKSTVSAPNVSKASVAPSEQKSVGAKQGAAVLHKKGDSSIPSTDSVKGNSKQGEVLSRLRARKPEQLPKQEAPLTPISKIERDREDTRAKVIKKVSELSPDTRVERKMLVTEQITVICPHLNLTFVLNRQANKFTAHFKGDPKPQNQAKRERKHWNLSTALLREWRKSANAEGNNPLHLAILKEDLGLIMFFVRENMVKTPNNVGDLPMHLAAKATNPEILRLLIEKGARVDVEDRQKNTPLHLACSAENVESVRILVQSGANLDKENASKQTPRSIIESSKNPKLKECLAIVVNPKV